MSVTGKFWICFPAFGAPIRSGDLFFPVSRQKKTSFFFISSPAIHTYTLCFQLHSFQRWREESQQQFNLSPFNSDPSEIPLTPLKFHYSLMCPVTQGSTWLAVTRKLNSPGYWKAPNLDMHKFSFHLRPNLTDSAEFLIFQWELHDASD